MLDENAVRKAIEKYRERRPRTTGKTSHGTIWRLVYDIIADYEAAKAAEPVKWEQVNLITSPDQVRGYARTSLDEHVGFSARTIDQFPEGERTKPEEWEAMYAALFRQMHPIMQENNEAVELMKKMLAELEDVKSHTIYPFTTDQWAKYNHEIATNLIIQAQSFLEKHERKKP